ncbi:D-altritol 5-dehydrogenase-like isoform X2 [Bacillus rossius redtenbacheri]|uniref:D-altritol 5-dehydrogenase-like isoform X2 n=1 Tax=Bacillus rossius redtenbacheri TaxID=93214 RepID=UPI002FDE2105
MDSGDSESVHAAAQRSDSRGSPRPGAGASCERGVPQGGCRPCSWTRARASCSCAWWTCHVPGARTCSCRWPSRGSAARTCTPCRGCDRCGLCQDGRYQFCEVDAAAHSVGMWRDGGWAELCLVPEKNLHRLPAGMSLRQASLMEPLSCVVHGWELAAPLPVGSRVLVLGAGVIGNLWAALLHHHGHRQVTVSEPLEGRRRALHKLGTGYEVVSPAELRAKPAGWTVDLVVDCSGHAPAVQHALGLLGPGGTLLLFGVAPPRAVISISPYDMYKNELKIKAVNRNPFTCNKALGLIEAMGDRYIDFEKLGVKTFRLTEYKSAIEELAKGSISKAMFEVDAEFPKGA